MRNLIPFAYQGKDVPVIIDAQGEPWWVAKDVCEIFQITDTAQAVERLDDDEKLVRTLYVSGQNRDVWTVNEPGLYHLAGRSNKPEAKRFQKWVRTEVLPQIRRTGAYVPDGVVNLHPIAELTELRSALTEASTTIRKMDLVLQSTHRVNYYLRKVERLQSDLDKKGSKLTADEVYQAHAMKHQGKTSVQIARLLGRSPSTVRRCLNGGAQ